MYITSSRYVAGHAPIWIDLDPSDRCPCGKTSLSLARCCLSSGRVHVKPTSLYPPAPLTLETRDGCFFGPARDCLGPMSGDHMISRTVMQSFGGGKVRFQSPFFAGEIPVDHSATKTKWVCQRHNSMFSPLDSAAGRLTTAMHRGWDHIDGAGTSTETILLSGVDVERWLAKTLLATFFGGAGGPITKKTHVLPPFMEPLFFDDEWPAPSGLYVAVGNEGAPLTSFERTTGVGIRPVSQGAQIVGVVAEMRGFDLMLWLSPQEPPNMNRLKFRPSWFHFGRSPIAGVNIGLSWHADFGGTVWLRDQNLEAANS